jgi:hypothetical protein
MVKYIRLAVLGAFFAPQLLYWVILSVCVIGVIVSVIVREKSHFGDWLDAEQPYNMTVGYIVDNGKTIPKMAYYTENGKRKVVPPCNTSITYRGNGVYDLYVRIRRKDGTGYDYSTGVLKKISETKYKTLKVSCGREWVR